ncbi:protein kinase domain-containing protein [Sorangium sp. So ce131]|uniref:serine/threonine-protein kinase n=1 Tax=Sorangium sp. So ce131 TaxID=3133282 RepID=UPI003F5DF74A
MSEQRVGSAAGEPVGDAGARVLAGRYHLRELLGRGAHGEVWGADDPVLGEQVAIKLLLRAGAESARVRREIAALRMLRLPGVVRLLDEGMDEGRPFFVMERVDGAPFPGRLVGDAGEAADVGDAADADEAADGEESAPASRDDRTVSASAAAAASAIAASTTAASAAAAASAIAASATAASAIAASATAASATAASVTAASEMRPRCVPRPARRAPRWNFSAIAAPTEALLEILARVHVAGIVHRDLKPANVLLRPDGRPVVLDFGLSLGPASPTRAAMTETEEGLIVGTPAYLAPEQIRGGPIDARADLYAVGAMLYEALTGSLPHDAPTVQGLLLLRLTQTPVPVRDHVPELPQRAADLVDRLLARSPEDRPRSAADALALLRGQAGARRAARTVPRLGGDAPVQAIVAAARAGRALDVTGPRGSGRTCCLEDAAEALEREGRRVIRLAPGRRPLASLSSAIGSLEDLASAPLDEVLSRAEALVRGALAADAVLVADDAERLDPWSSAALARCREAGAVIRAFTDDARTDGAAADRAALRLAPLDEGALRPLFAGPDRLFHLGEDAARALWERSAGLPARVAAEVDAWVRAGFGRWDDARLVVERDTLDRLQSGLPIAAPTEVGAEGQVGAEGPAVDEPHLEELCAWLGVAGSRLDAAQIARLMRQPRFRVEAELGALCARGWARRAGADRFELLVQAGGGWSEDERRAAQRAVAGALAPGAPGRLFLLIAAGEDERAAGEALAASRRLAEEGLLGQAAAALHEGLLAARRGPEAAALRWERRLLPAWVEIACAERSPRALDRVLYELCRARSRAAPEVARLEALVRAVILVDGPSWRGRAREAADALGPFEEPALERWRQWVRVRAGVRQGPEALEAALEAAQAWAAATGHPEAQAAVAGWTGLLRYAEGRFEEAARWHAAAVARETWPPLRLASTLNEAAALLEAFQPARAAARAQAAGEMAARCRHPYFEARAEWTRRTAAYRMGEALAPDAELVEACAALSAPDHFALVCCTEAAIAYRAGDLAAARDLAARAADTWRRLDHRWPELFGRCFAAAVRGGLPEEEARALAAQAARCPVPGLGVQSLALLRRACPALPPFPDEVLAPLCRGVPEARWDDRLDVLSVRESLAAAGGGTVSPLADEQREQR